LESKDIGIRISRGLSTVRGAKGVIRLIKAISFLRINPNIPDFDSLLAATATFVCAHFDDYCQAGESLGTCKLKAWRRRFPA
jgi:hypothetical protein